MTLSISMRNVVLFSNAKIILIILTIYLTPVEETISKGQLSEHVQELDFGLSAFMQFLYRKVVMYCCIANTIS
jgi:hypothetical protein